MAFTFRGIGTAQYGKRDFQPDGSFVTTLWFVFLYLPVFPIHSKRLRATGEVKYYSTRAQRTLLVLEKTKPHPKQVLSVYGWFATELAIFLAARILNLWWIAIPGIALLGLPWYLRHKAIERMKAEMSRAAMGFAPALPED